MDNRSALSKRNREGAPTRSALNSTSIEHHAERDEHKVLITLRVMSQDVPIHGYSFSFAEEKQGGVTSA